MLKKTGEVKITLAKKPMVLFSSDAKVGARTENKRDWAHQETGRVAFDPERHSNWTCHIC